MRIHGLLVIAFVAGACSGGGSGETVTGPTNPGGPTAPSPPASSASVQMRSEGDIYGTLNHSFSPSSVTVARNGTVTWNNASANEHNVTFTAATGAPASIPNSTSGSYNRTFPTAGTFSYACTNHDGMGGQVTVQ